MRRKSDEVYKLSDEESEVVAANHNLIYSFANSKKIPIDEYYGELAFALIKAVKTFDKSRGVFSSYAYKIMLNELNMARRVRVKGSDNSSLEYIIASGEGEELTLINVIVGEENMEDNVLFSTELSKRIQYLSIRELEALYLRLCGDSQEQIGKRLNISRAYVCRVMKKIANILSCKDNTTSKSMQLNKEKYDTDEEYRCTVNSYYNKILYCVSSYNYKKKPGTRKSNLERSLEDCGIKRAEKAEQTEKAEKAERTSRVGRLEKAEHVRRAERTEEVERIEKKQEKRNTADTEVGANTRARAVIYPGSFNPITLGHIDIIERASKLFDKVIVAVGVNTSKKYAFTQDERKGMVAKACKHLNNVEVDTYTGLLAEYLKSRQASAIIRGLRALSDFESEFQMSLANQSINEDFETLFIPSKLEHMYLSSSMVREIASLSGDIGKYVPKEIVNDILMKFNSNN